MIQWFSSLDELEQLTEQYYKTHAVYFDNLCINTAVSFAELQAILPLPPDPNPFPSEPGPHEYWYGCVNDLPFLITYYHREDIGDMSIGTFIRTFPSPSTRKTYFWSTLEKMITLPKPLMQRIFWIGWWNSKKKPVRSIYCQEDPIWQKPPIEMYQAETVEEAEALLGFLQSLQPEYTYYIDRPSNIPNQV